MTNTPKPALPEALREKLKRRDFEQVTNPKGGNMQQPTIGRIVHYQRFGSPGGEHKPEPSPAVITKVLDDQGKCALFVMNPNGCYFNETPYSEEPKPGHWNWPPRI